MMEDSCGITVVPVECVEGMPRGSLINLAVEG